MSNMQTHIEGCQVCKGDGIRVVKRNADPAINIALLTLQVDKHGAIQDWRGPCIYCDGWGAFEWTRGSALTPLIGGNQHG